MASLPPPLPRRAADAVTPPDPGFGSGSGSAPGPAALHALQSTDPRLSSTQSLAPADDCDAALPHPRRKLFVVYIHGFYGNTQSFRSFPAHVHALLQTLVADSHVVHSKIYPRYKTYRAIEVARDNFSEWLEPHESPTTDVILVGHSMGGLLAADVVLMPNRNPYHQRPFKHRILDIIALDAPFLGLHPGIIPSGISSLFRPASPRPQPRQHDDYGGASCTTLSPSASTVPSLPTAIPNDLGAVPPALSSLTQPATDPHFNPPFWNDKPYKEQPFFHRITHFANKHLPEGFFVAAWNHFLSHLEFGGCLADYFGLISRYNQIRALEDVDEVQVMSSGTSSATVTVRVRFANYYTLSTGPLKSPKPVPCPSAQPGAPCPSKVECDSMASASSVVDGENGSKGDNQSSLSTPAIAVNIVEEETGSQIPNTIEDARETREGPHTGETKSMPVLLSRVSTVSIRDSGASAPESLVNETDVPPNLPPIPPEPVKPELPPLMDKEARKTAEKEVARAQAEYDQAVRDRAKIMNEHERARQRRRKEAHKEAMRRQNEVLKAQLRRAAEAKKVEKEKETKKEEKRGRKEEAEKEKRKKQEAQTQAEQECVDGKRRKTHKFCNVPSGQGQRDAAWIEVYMEGMSQVDAHCGLFLEGPHYDALVGDVGSRIASWVFDDLTNRAILGGLS